jgi:predicted phosphodiesterase
MTQPFERIGVIGDIHAEDVHLEEAIRVLEEREVDLLVATGDVADGSGSVDRCCELLAAHGVVTVSGNHDRWLLAGTARDEPDSTVLAFLSDASRAFLAQLPRMVELGTAGGLALVCHGLGPNDMGKVGPDDFGYALESNDDLQNLLRERRYRWVVNGHSHCRMLRAFPGVSIINAGTLQPGVRPACFLEVDFRRGEVVVFEFGDDGTIPELPSPMALE